MSPGDLIQYENTISHLHAATMDVLNYAKMTR
jgi:hypothetical protein